MATNTTNLGLKKPAYTDPVDVQDFNSNFDKIDDKIGNLSGSIPFVNVKYPPAPYVAAKGDGVTDDTNAIQNLHNNFPYVYIPNGTYIVSQLILKSFRTIIGQSSHDTIIQAKVSTQASLFVLDVGPVLHVRMENLWFQGIGSQNSNQNGLYFQAKPTVASPNNGGLWLSLFKNIIIKGFDGVQLALRAGSNSSLPHQALTFERVECIANNGSNVNSKALLVEGQTEQITWNECAFSATTKTAASTNVVFQRQRDVNNNVVGDEGGNGQTFLQCYFGNAVKGITFERSSNIKIYGGYFENLQKCIDVTISSYGITIEKSEFRTSGTVGDGSGYLIYGDNMTSEYRFIDNELVSTPENICTGWGNKTIKGNRSTATSIIPMANTVTDYTITNSAITMQSFAGRINTSAGLNTINSDFQGNDEIILIAWVAGGFTLTTGGNINVGKTVTLNQNDYVTLIRLDNQWWIKSIVTATTYHA